MKKCSNCGAGNLDEAKFCHQCGNLIARERPISESEMTQESKRPSLDDLEFVETDLTNENPRTHKMKDKVSLSSTEKTQVASAVDQPKTQIRHKDLPEVRQTLKQEKPMFVDSLESVNQTTRLADTGDVFIADVLANIDTDIDLDADAIDWHKDQEEQVDPESLAVPVERVGKAQFARDAAASAKPLDPVLSKEQAQSVEKPVAVEELSLKETDLIASTADLDEEVSADDKIEAKPIASPKSSRADQSVDQTQQEPTGEYTGNPIFKREPVYLKPETYGPNAQEAQRKLEAELATVVSTIQCPHCGHQNPDYYSFCQACKKKLYDYDDQTSTTEVDLAASSNLPASLPDSELEDVEEELFVPAYIGAEASLDNSNQSKSHKKKHKKARKRKYGWLITLLLIIVIVAGGVFAYFYFFGSETANAVYQQYSEAIATQDYSKAASLTASTNGHAWTDDDVEQMLANYSEAGIDLAELLAANPEVTELDQDNHLILEVDTEPSFLGLFPEYQVFVQAINVALSVPNDYRDIAITTLSHQAQPITAGDAIILEPRENYIVVHLTESGEAREIGIDLNYRLLTEGTLPISLKQVENRIQADLTTLPGAYPQEFSATGFVIDGQEYTADIITLNGYVGQGFTVSIRGEYFSEAVESSQQEIHLVDDNQVLVSLAGDEALLAELQAIEAENSETIANRTPLENADAWLQSFQNDFVDAINFRAPEMLAKYGTDSEWYTTTANWIQNEVVPNGIYYNTASYEIISVEPNELGQLVLTSTELYDYTLGGVAAVQAQSKVYVLVNNGGQLEIVSVTAQDIAN